jgi:hypothetical protein
MSLSHETMLELMSLADGELEGDDKERIERLVASDGEARQVYASLCGEEVSAWLAETMDRRAIAGGADQVADAVMAAVASGAANGAGRATAPARDVGSLDEARVRRRSRLQTMATASGAVLALAAGVLLYVHAGSQHVDTHAPVASVVAPSVDVQAPPSAMAQQGAGGGVEVNEIDAPSRGVSVFEIPAGAAAVAQPTGPSSVVIWVDDDPGSK